MSEFLSADVRAPDFYVAAMGRSGSTALCNWLARPPEQLVFIEPFFSRPRNPRLLRIQLSDFGLPVEDQDWEFEDPTPAQRFRRLMSPRLRGRRWALKEVLSEEHFRTIEAFSPPRVLIAVRNIADVALSFFEKHRVQRNLRRFGDEWVRSYCIREAAGLLRLPDTLARRNTPFLIVRYEDFARSEQSRERITGFVDWTPGGDAGSHLAKFDRAFEIERHGRGISGNLRARSERNLEREHLLAADEIASQCAEYQQAFGFA